MGKRHRNQRQEGGPSARVKLEQLLTKGDTRGAVEAAKLLVREEPGSASEELAVRAYAARIQELIAEGLGREAAALASIVRERFPAQLESVSSLLDDARLAAGDFDWILRELRDASAEQRAALEERLLPWIVDPAALGRSGALDSGDPLAGEARVVAELFEIVTSRLASAEEMGALNDVRRRSPLAPWKLLLRAIDAFHRNDDDRVTSNVAAIDARSPAARAGAILTELTTGRANGKRSFAAERLIDRISGGRASITAQIRNIDAASRQDDRRTVREEMRALAKAFDTLSPYASEQLRLALLPLIGFLGAEQVASLYRLRPLDPAMERYAALVLEGSGLPFAVGRWLSYADGQLDHEKLEPWQAAEIYLHALLVGEECGAPFDGHDPMYDLGPYQSVDTPRILERIIALRPAPAVLDRLAPYLNRLERKDLRRVLTAWRKADPESPVPLVRLLRMAEDEQRYDDGLALIRQVDRMKTMDPEYGRLRLQVSLRKAEQLLAAKKRDAAAELLAEIAARPEDLGEAATTYLLALQWAAAPPPAAGELLAQLAQRGVAGELVLAEVTGVLKMPFALPASHPSPEELLEGIHRGLTALRTAGVTARHVSWLLERTRPHLELANEEQLIAIASAALMGGMNELAWAATSRGLELRGPKLHRLLLIRAGELIEVRAATKRILDALDAARMLAQRAQDSDVVARATAIEDQFQYFGRTSERLSQDALPKVIERERTAAMPSPPQAPRKKPRGVKPKPKSPRKRKSEKVVEP